MSSLLSQQKDALASIARRRNQYNSSSEPVLRFLSAAEVEAELNGVRGVCGAVQSSCGSGEKQVSTISEQGSDQIGLKK